MDSIISKEAVEGMVKALSRFGEEIQKLTKPAYATIKELHKLSLQFDEKYARKFRHLNKYTRMYERGKRRHG